MITLEVTNPLHTLFPLYMVNVELDIGHMRYMYGIYECEEKRRTQTRKQHRMIGEI